MAVHDFYAELMQSVDVPPLGARFVRPAWMADAACARPHEGVSFFIERGQPSEPAKQVCSACPVRDECLAYALDNREHFGIWGGTSERERKKLNRQRNQHAA